MILPMFILNKCQSFSSLSRGVKVALNVYEIEIGRMMRWLIIFETEHPVSLFVYLLKV